MLKENPAGESTDEVDKPKKEWNYKKIAWHQCQCSGSSQIPSQDDLNYHQFLSLYCIEWRKDRTELIIYNTESKNEEVKVLDTELELDLWDSITQLPNGELFCYGNFDYGTTVIIDRSYGVRVLPSGTPCQESSALYFDNNIYCFGGYKIKYLALSKKFDLEKNRWINLPSLPNTDHFCHSVIFNRNILISGSHSNNLWLYSTEIDSFSIIPYVFKVDWRKILINVERLYCIEWDMFSNDYSIYESEDEYNWQLILNSVQSNPGDFQMYCLYNNKKIYISRGPHYYQFDLKKKVMREIK